MGAGSQSVVTGYNYWGSYAIAICLGGRDGVRKLNKASNGDTVIWTGPIDRSSRDGDGKTTLTTTIGTIDFFWGTADQLVHPILAGLVIDLGSGPETVPMSAYRMVCYAVCLDVAFGGQVTPPTLSFEVECESAGLALSAHSIDGDAVLPEAIYDYLTSDFYGAGVPTSEIDTPSFVAASEIVIDEELGFSPAIDQTETDRDLIGRMLAHIDGFLYFDGGKFKLGLNRFDSAGVPILDENDFLEEPVRKNVQFEGTWNKSILTFQDRENNWEESSEPYVDQANFAIVRRVIPNTLDFPWVTKRSVAKKVVKRVGVLAGRPIMFWDLKLPPRWKTLKPGDRFKISFAKLGIVERKVIVRSVRRGPPSEPQIQVTVQEDIYRDETHDYMPPEDTFGVPPTLDPTGSDAFEIGTSTPRLSWLPDDLKAGEADGILVAVDRPDSISNGGSVYWTYDPMVREYQLIAAVASFPAKAELLCWHIVRSTNWLFRIKLPNAWDYSWIQALRDEAVTFYAVVGRRDWKTVGTPKNEHEVLAPWLIVVSGGIFDLISSTVIDVELTGGSFSTSDLSLETLVDDSVSPTLHVYFGRTKDFVIYPSDAIKFERAAGNSLSDTGEVRFIKTPIQNHLDSQDLADVTAAQYDRNDTTMCPDGTYSTEWGPRAKTCYEVYDEQSALIAMSLPAPDYYVIAEIDAALGAIYAGTATADQILRAESVDAVLGNMITTGQLFYNL